MKKTEENGKIIMTLYPNDYIRLIDSVGATIILKVVDESGKKIMAEPNVDLNKSTIIKSKTPTEQQKSEISVEANKLGIWSEEKEKRNNLMKPFVISFLDNPNATLSADITSENADNFILYLRGLVSK